MSASSADALAVAVRDAIASTGDAERAADQQRYMKSALPYQGISSPDLRALLRPVLAAHVVDDRHDLDRAVRNLWDEATHREEWYAAIAVIRLRGHRQWLDAAALPLLRHLVVTGAWWDVVDEVAQHCVGAVLAGDPAAVGPVMEGWAQDPDLWVRRAAILCQNRRRADTDQVLLEKVLDANLEDSLHGTEFFIRKAIGWALREHAKTDPDWVMTYVAERQGRISALSRREALKHIG